MGDLIIKPADEGHLKLQNDAGTTILEMVDDESKLRLAQNNVSASDGTTAITTSGANVTLAGTANDIGTVTGGTFNSILGELAQLKIYTHSHTTSGTEGGANVFAFGTSLTIPSSGNPNGSKFLVFVGGGRWNTGNAGIYCRPSIRTKEGSDFSAGINTEGSTATTIIQPSFGGDDTSENVGMGVYTYTNSSGSATALYIRSAMDIVDSEPQNPHWYAGGNNGAIGLVAVKYN